MAMTAPKTPAEYAAELRAEAEATPPGPARNYLLWIADEWDKLIDGVPARMLPAIQSGKLGRRDR
jgi:hypothetical protein